MPDLFDLIGPDGRRRDLHDAEGVASAYPRHAITDILNYRQSVNDGKFRLVARGNGRIVELRFTHAQAKAVQHFLEVRTSQRWDGESTT